MRQGSVARFQNCSKLPMMLSVASYQPMMMSAVLHQVVLNPDDTLQTLNLAEIERLQQLSGRGLQMSFFSCGR